MRVTDFMNFITKLNFTILFLPFILVFTVTPCMSEVNEPGTIVLTFDDSVASHATFVAPLLKKYGFGATFFVRARTKDS
jgi:peptidoglycan/xylan/chitin deacetylase (PgdA/CDA1 family)